jgi:hypothetical protein
VLDGRSQGGFVFRNRNLQIDLMSKIESVAANIPYEKDPYGPYQYSVENIAAWEQLVGRSFPDDFKWYLLNIGSLRTDSNHRAIIIRADEYLYLLKFEAVEKQVFVQGRYEEYVAGKAGEFLPHNRALYFPFAKIEGEMNPSVTFHVFISLNEENFGSVWTGMTTWEKDPRQPLKIADDFTSFLEQIGANKTLEPVAEANNEELFLKLKANHEAAGQTAPTSAADPKELLRRFFEPTADKPFVFDGVHGVEYQRRRNGQTVKNQGEFRRKSGLFLRSETACVDSRPPATHADQNQRTGAFRGGLLVHLEPAQLSSRDRGKPGGRGYFAERGISGASRCGPRDVDVDPALQSEDR